MKLNELFSGLAEAVISEETTANNGSLALPRETYTFKNVVGPSKRVGRVMCTCRKGEELIAKELSALALLELLQEGVCVYNYRDVMLYMYRVLGGVAQIGENETFTKKLTIL